MSACGCTTSGYPDGRNRAALNHPVLSREAQLDRSGRFLLFAWAVLASLRQGLRYLNRVEDTKFKRTQLGLAADLEGF